MDQSSLRNPLDQSYFSNCLGFSSVSNFSHEHKIEQKAKMIEFYLEEKVRREELH